MNTSISLFFLKFCIKIPKLLCKCILLNFFSDLFQLVKFCYSALHLHLKHFRSLEERKKQHKEGLYLSDTLPRKKTTPSISPHFSSATMGRSTAPKVGCGVNHGLCIQWVFLSSCWPTLQRLLNKMPNNKPLSLLVGQTENYIAFSILLRGRTELYVRDQRTWRPGYFLPSHK